MQMENNPYRPRSMLWALVEEDFSDLAVKQIAEIFDTDEKVIYQAMTRIKRETGMQVKYLRIRKSKLKKRRDKHGNHS